MMTQCHRIIYAALFLGGIFVIVLLGGIPHFRLFLFARGYPSASDTALAQPSPPPASAPGAQAEPGMTQMEIPQKMKAKQEKELRKYRFDQLKEHAAELAKLANSLHEDLDKSNINILSLQVVDKAAKIEKLAKKIQDEAKAGT